MSASNNYRVQGRSRVTSAASSQHHAIWRPLAAPSSQGSHCCWFLALALHLLLRIAKHELVLVPLTFVLLVVRRQLLGVRLAVVLVQERLLVGCCRWVLS